MILRPTKQLGIESLHALLARPLMLRLYTSLDAAGNPVEPRGGYRPLQLAGWQVDGGTLTATLTQVLFTFSGRTDQPIVGVYITNGDGPPLYKPAKLPDGPHEVLRAGDTLEIPAITISVPGV